MGLIANILKIPGHVMGRRRGKFSEVPVAVVGLSLFMAINVVGQLLADLGLEILTLRGILESHSFRMEFLFLAFISALLGLFTLKGLQRKEIDVTWNSLILSLFIETFLVISDLIFLATESDLPAYMPITRAPFLVLTSINIGIIVYILWKMHLRTLDIPPFRH